MTIKKIKDQILTEADIGKFVLKEGDSEDEICGYAWKLDEINKSRCKVSRVRRKLNREVVEVEEDVFTMKSIKFIADTEMEAEWLRAMSEKKQRELFQLKIEVNKKYDDLIFD